MSQALSMLTSEPTTVVTPYSADVPKPVITSSIEKKPVITSSVNRTPTPKTTATNQTPTPVIKSTVTKTPVTTAPAVPKVVTPDPQIRSLYENIKKQIKEQK